MADYTIKELATTFSCSKQSIFNYMDELKVKGFTSKKGNQILVSEAGFNYILEKKQASGKVADNKTKQERSEKDLNDISFFYKLQTETFEKQIEELKKEKEYYRKKLEEKEDYIKHLQDTLTEMSIKAMQIALPKGQESQEEAENTEQKETTHKGLFARLFSKK